MTPAFSFSVPRVRAFVLAFMQLIERATTALNHGERSIGVDAGLVQLFASVPGLIDIARNQFQLDFKGSNLVVFGNLNDYSSKMQTLQVERLFPALPHLPPFETTTGVASASSLRSFSHLCWQDVAVPTTIAIG